MAMTNIQFQQKTEATNQNLQTWISQLAITISELKSQGSGQLPSQTMSNPRGNVIAIMLRSGKELQAPTQAKKEQPSSAKKSEDAEPIRDNAKTSNNSKQFVVNIPLPFPSRVTPNKKRVEAESNKEIMENFGKVEANIPLLEAIKQIAKYPMFLKDLCIKRRLKGNKKVSMGKNVFAIIQPSIPPKCKDLGTFTIPCIIGSKQFSQAMLDLGASINMMHKSIHQSLHIGELKLAGVVIQLTNQSTTHPEGVVKDVLVRVNDLIFPANFYVLNMEDDVHVR